MRSYQNVYLKLKKTPQQINIQSPNIMIKIKKSGYFNK